MKYFVIIPELVLTGPAKGAIALSNGLISQNKAVSLIVLKRKKKIPEELKISKLVSIHYLNGDIFSKYKLFKRLVCEQEPNFRISIGFSADILNYFTNINISHRICSVRGNLHINYYLDFGILGRLLAYIHYKIISKFPIVLSMTEAMKSDLKTNFNIDSFLVGNFLDELSVSSFQIAKKDDKEIYFTFVGSLTQRKNVFFLIESFIKFSKNRSDVKLFIVGDGPLKEKVSILIKNHQEKIKYLGFLDSPYELLAKSHVFVLLSSSEGMSRAALEALFLGNIGLLSNVEGNSELIVQGVNGYLFDLNSDDIVKYFEKCYNHVRLTPNSNKSFLPPEFNQKTQTKNLIKLLEYHDKNN